MSEIDYIGASELVFNNNMEGGIHSGGFSVNSIMLKGGMSPIMTINTEQLGGTNNKVSDLFNDLVVPSWVLSYNNRLVGGKYKEVEHNSDSEDDDVIEDDLHDRLLDLVKEHNAQQEKKQKKRLTRRSNSKLGKKNNTKRNR